MSDDTENIQETDTERAGRAQPEDREKKKQMHVEHRVTDPADYHGDKGLPSHDMEAEITTDYKRAPKP